MTLNEIVEKLQLKVCSGENKLNQEITGGYASDLMSDVIANSKAGNIWITMQIHINIAAVAVLKDLAAIVIVQGREPQDDTLKKAVEENVPLLVSKLPAFQLVGRMYELGVGKN
ncbi:MAG: serine kinase [Bacteroidetes bacterium]|nr:serine kinase [Bacteroidota bacterium]